MAYRILLTSLYEVRKKSPMLYFYTKEDNRIYFCDAILSTEAITKYVLSRKEIDEIVALGNWPAFDENDSSEAELRDGMNYFTSDLSNLSTFSIFNYRLAQYLDDLKIDEQDLADLIDPDEQAKAIGYVNGFCRSGEDDNRLSLLFEDLALNKELYRRFADGLAEIAEDEASYETMLMWTKGYLFRKLKDSRKMDVLRENEDIKVSYVSASLPDDGILPVDSMLKTMKSIMESGEEVEIVVALDNNDVSGNFVLMNLLDIADKMYGKKIEVINIFDTVEAVNAIAEQIRDDTIEYGITELTAAMRAFLKYGKADMLLDYWEKNGYRNEPLERMLYSMRKIDTGLALCSIKEMEEGIDSLKQLFRERETAPFPDDFFGKMFRVFAEGIVLDYGKLMDGDETDFIEMVKWGYRKNFLQQTLTLIEARAPREFIRKGIFYYCSSDEEKPHCIDILAGERMRMKPFEYWHMDDMDHYFIKTYIRKNKLDKRSAEDLQLLYARLRVGYLDNEDPEVLTAYTACDDRELLTNLLYSYYHVGEVRNFINHAEDKLGADKSLMPSEKDESSRLHIITEAIEYFISNYDAMIANIGDKEPVVVRINSEEVKAVAKKREEEERKSRYGDRDRDKGGRE